MVLAVGPPVPFGPSTDHGSAVAGPLVTVASVGVRAVLVLDHHQVGRHLLELVHQPLPLHFSKNASLVVVPTEEKKADMVPRLYT